MQYKFHLVIMVPVTSALLVPEPGGVHELVDHDARVNAARSQGNLQQIAQTLILSSMEVSGARTCCLLPHLPTELLHPLPFMMWMKSFCLTRGTNWKEITFLQVDTSFNWLENLICAAVSTPCAYYGTGTTIISTFQVNKKCVPSPKRIVVQVGENTTGWQWWLVTWVGLTMLLVIPLSARFCLGRWGFGRIGWVTGKDGWTSQIKVNPTHVTDHHCHPVMCQSQMILARMQVFSLYSLMAFAMTARSLVLKELAMVYGITPPDHLALCAMLFNSTKCYKTTNLKQGVFWKKMYYRVIHSKWTFWHPPYLCCRWSDPKTIWGGDSHYWLVWFGV